MSFADTSNLTNSVAPSSREVAPEGSAGTAPLRLAEFIGRLSLAFDIQSDGAPGKVVRVTVLAVEIGRRAGLGEADLHQTFWETLLDRFGIGAPPLLAERIAHDQASAQYRYEPARLSQLLLRIATRVETAHHREGRAAALDVVGLHAEVEVDARLARVLHDEQMGLFEALEDPEIFTRFLELEPTPWEWADEARVEGVARALGAVVEREIPMLAGHSARVAALSERAAALLGLGADETRALRLAAFLHEIGRSSVPNAIWARPRALDWGAWERVRLHPCYAARVLGPIAALAEVGNIATAAHERMDGSGYPQRRSSRALTSAARVLAAADVAVAMSETRPHRPPLTPEALARELVAEADSGHLDSRAVDAVLTVIGATVRSAPSSSHGLSHREIDVSRLLVRGKSDKEIGALLQISPRTVQVHVSRILDKLGVRSRAGAAVWLIENDMVR